jgi:hypothetical protein
VEKNCLLRVILVVLLCSVLVLGVRNGAYLVMRMAAENTAAVVEVTDACSQRTPYSADKDILRIRVME